MGSLIEGVLHIETNIASGQESFNQERTREVSHGDNQDHGQVLLRRVRFGELQQEDGAHRREDSPGVGQAVRMGESGQFVDMPHMFRESEAAEEEAHENDAEDGFQLRRVDV